MHAVQLSDCHDHIVLLQVGDQGPGRGFQGSTQAEGSAGFQVVVGPVHWEFVDAALPAAGG